MSWRSSPSGSPARRKWPKELDRTIRPPELGAAGRQGPKRRHLDADGTGHRRPCGRDVSRTFNDPPDNHLSRTPMTVDAEGWEEVLAELNATLDRLLDIQAQV